MKRKIFSIFVTALLLLIAVFATAPVSSAEGYSGICGPDLQWTFYEDTGELSIYGTGGMDFFSQNENFRVHSYEIKTVNIGPGVTYVETFDFTLMDNLEEFIVSSYNDYLCNDENGVLYTKDKSTLLKFPEGSELEHFEVPSTVDVIEEFAFYDCTELETIKVQSGVKEIRGNAFSFISATVELPESVETITNDAFEYSSTLELYYTGTESQWKSIKVVPHFSTDTTVDELGLSYVTVNYNSTMPGSDSAPPSEDVLFTLSSGKEMTKKNFLKILYISLANAVFFSIIFFVGKKIITKKSV